MISGHLSRASAMGMTFLTPRSFASREQAMTQVCLASANGTTPTGLPRKCGCACCSTVMTVLEKLSGEIPVKIDTKERREALQENVAECCGQNSWVALDDMGCVVGFLLGKTHVDPGWMRTSDGTFNHRPEYEFDGITLPYGGVLDGYRKRGRFSRLLSEAQALKRPLQVDVSHENKCGVGDQLENKGFMKKPCSCFPNQDYFVWFPKPQSKKGRLLSEP
jgi:hypothetical protein